MKPKRKGAAAKGMSDRDKELEMSPAGEAPGGETGGEEPGGEAPGGAAELRSRLAYLAAEFDNYRKRVQREHETLTAFGNEKLLRALLPVLDNLERALAQGAGTGGSAAAEALLSGVRMTYDLFLSELRKFGVEQFSVEGKPFDPSLHEAVAHLPSPDAPEGTVVAEARKGYLLHGRLLRPAQVAVAGGGVPAEED
jgi:molecular chaperone GrpE